MLDPGHPSPGVRALKRYDRAYFDRWYRGADALGDPGILARHVALAVAAAESILNRALTSVLDVGCGEGRWQPVLHQLRPGASYLGVDPSPYAVERYGGDRNLVSGSFRSLESLAFDEPFDLVVCADVLHYLDDREIMEGLDTLVDLTGGVALIEVFTVEDDPEGDREGFHPRPAAWYRRLFQAAGLVPIGLQMYVHRETAGILDALDAPQGLTPGR